MDYNGEFDDFEPKNDDYDDDDYQYELPEHLKNENFKEKKEDLDKYGRNLLKVAPKAELARDLENNEVTNEAIFGMEDMDENLGENFEDTPWVPPSIDKAKKYQASHLYHSGNAHLRTVDITSVADLGASVPLYFQFVKSMAFAFFFMFLCSIPVLGLAFYGSRVPEQDKDSVNFYRFTVANIGYDPDSLTYENDTFCETHNASYTSVILKYVEDYSGENFTNTIDLLNTNLTCIHGFGYEIPAIDAYHLISLMECLQMLIFLIAVYHIGRRVRSFKEKNDSKLISITHYTVKVTHIPPDTTPEQMIEHFSNLYPLNCTDWRGRHAVRGARPVERCDTNPMLEGTWIADCVIHKKIGGFIKAFRAKHDLMESLYLSRAEMKMYSPNTPLATGENPKLYAKAEKKMCEIASNLDNFTERLNKQGILKVKTHKIVPVNKDVEAPTPGGRKSLIHNRADKDVDADAVAAFVTFEYNESMARCLDDYLHYEHFPYTFFMPEKLKFRGKNIFVTKALEPDEIVWENLEIPWYVQRLKRIRTNAITVLLVLLCFVVILQAAIYKQKFNDKLPTTEICKVEIPALYADSYTYDSGDIELVRPTDVVEMHDLDSQCSDIVLGSFYGQFSVHGNYSVPIGSYDIAQCGTTGSANLCPIPSKVNPMCPCVVTKSNENICNSLRCYKDADDNFNDDHTGPTQCTTFDSSLIGGCYCLNLLQEILTSGSVMGSVSAIREQATSSDAVCNEFFMDYSLAQGLTYMAILVSLIINDLLKKALKYLTRTECHTSVDKEQGSLLIKIFVSVYFNLAFVVLIAFGYLPDLPSAISVTQIFSGSYGDFTISWYGAVGSLFVGSMVIQSVGAQISPLFDFHILKPCTRLYNYDSVHKVKNTAFKMQHQLNMLEVGPVFDTSIKAANVLALLFFGMTYASGIPLMTPLLFLIFFWYFYTDRKLLCFYYQRPPRLGDAIMQTVLRMLPFAVIIRLAIGCWMYSTEGILPGISVDLYKPPLFNDSAVRLEKSNVLPLGVLLVCVLLYEILRLLWEYSFIHPVVTFLWQSIKRQWAYLSGRKVNSKIYPDENGYVSPYDLIRMGDPRRTDTAPYTGQYSRFVRDKFEVIGCDMCCTNCVTLHTQLTPAEEHHGWVITDLPEDSRYFVRMKVWQTTVNIAGTVFAEGEYKLTYQVIRDCGGMNTYALDKLPAYKMSMLGLREGTTNLLQYQAIERSGHHAAPTMQDLIRSTSGKHESIVDKYKNSKVKVEKKRREADSWGANQKVKEKRLQEADDDLYGEADIPVDDDLDVEAARGGDEEMENSEDEEEENEEESEEESEESDEDRLV